MITPNDIFLRGIPKPVVFASLLFISTAPSPAQTKPQGLTPQPNQTDSALTAQTRKVFVSISDNTLKAAREMPEGLYAFKPADGTRTFGQLVAHLANVQSTLCGSMNGEKTVKTPAKNESKESIITGLSASIGACRRAFDELSAKRDGRNSIW